MYGRVKMVLKISPKSITSVEHAIHEITEALLVVLDIQTDDAELRTLAMNLQNHLRASGMALMNTLGSISLSDPMRTARTIEHLDGLEEAQLQLEEGTIQARELQTQGLAKSIDVDVLERTARALQLNINSIR